MTRAPIALVFFGLFGNLLAVRVSQQMTLNGSETLQASSMEVDVNAKFKSGKSSSFVALSVKPQKAKKDAEVAMATLKPTRPKSDERQQGLTDLDHNMSDEPESFHTFISPPGIPVLWLEFDTHDPRIMFQPSYIEGKDVLVHFDPTLTKEQILVQILLITTLRAFKLGDVSEYYFKDGEEGYPQKDFLQNGDFRTITPSSIHFDDETVAGFENLLYVNGEDLSFNEEFQVALQRTKGGTVKQRYDRRDELFEEQFAEALRKFSTLSPDQGKSYVIESDSKPYANLLDVLQTFWLYEGKFHIVVNAPWFRFCQMERLPRYYPVDGGSIPINTRKLTKNPMEDLSMSIGDIASSQNYYLEMATSDVYLRQLWNAATHGGQRSAEIAMIDAHEPFPLFLTTLQLMNEFKKPLLLVLYSALKSLLIHTFAACPQPGLSSNLLKMEHDTQLLIVAPDAGQRHRLNNYFQELAGEVGGALAAWWGEEGSAKRFLAAAHMGKIRLEKGVELRCCSPMDADIDKSTIPGAGKKIAQAWAEEYFKKLSAQGKSKVLAVVVDDLTNSGGTLFTAANLLKNSLTMAHGSELWHQGSKIKYYAFVSHLVAGYGEQKLASMYNALTTKVFGNAESALDAIITTDTLPDIIRKLPQIISSGAQVPPAEMTVPQRMEILNWRTSVPTGIMALWHKSAKRSCSSVEVEKLCKKGAKQRYVNPETLSPGSPLPWDL